MVAMSHYEYVAKTPKQVIGMHHRIPEGGGLSAKLMHVWLLAELCILMFYNIRLDYLFVKGSFAKHWRYWCLLVGGPITATVVSFVYPWESLPMSVIGALFLTSWLYYFVGNTLFFRLSINASMCARFGKAKTIQLYELFLVSMWMGVQIGFHALIQATMNTGFSMHDYVGSPLLMQALGLTISICGYISKGWATWLIGVDNYFFRDQLIAQPNPYLVESKLFRYLKHPSYSVGYVVGYGYAIWADSWIGLPAAFLFQAGIFMFLKFAEEPGMKKLYAAASVES